MKLSRAIPPCRHDNPDKMILNVENSMTPISVFHRMPAFFGDIILDLWRVINLPPKGGGFNLF